MEVIIRNKESRATNTLALLSEILEAGSMEQHTAASLSGIMLFMEQQIFGRCGAIASRTLSRRLVDESGGWKRSASYRKLLEWLPRYFKLAPERVIRFCPGCGPVIICTGGAYEKGVATIGGTIVDGACRQTFGCTLPGMISTSGRRSERCEVLWSFRLKRRRVLWLIDNESARFALIAMSHL
jgi:hypothetical protein